MHLTQKQNVIDRTNQQPIRCSLVAEMVKSVAHGRGEKTRDTDEWQKTKGNGGRRGTTLMVSWLQAVAIPNSL